MSTYRKKYILYRSALKIEVHSRQEYILDRSTFQKGVHSRGVHILERSTVQIEVHSRKEYIIDRSTLQIGVYYRQEYILYGSTLLSVFEEYIIAKGLPVKFLGAQSPCTQIVRQLSSPLSNLETINNTQIVRHSLVLYLTQRQSKNTDSQTTLQSFI